MRKFTILGIILILVMMGSVVSAQDVTDSLISDGCAAVDAYSGATTGTTFDIMTDTELVKGDYVLFTVTVDGAGTIDLMVNGDSVATVDASEAGEYMVGYYVKETGNFTIAVEVTTASATDFGGDCQEGKPQICHIPPGNPDAAHTIEVGGPALKAHLAHGDSIGECPMGVESGYEDASGLYFLTVEEDGLMQIFENCDVECELVAEIEFTDLEAVEGWSFTFDADLGDEWEITVYFLTVYNENVNIFQVNVEKDGELVADSMLLFVDNDGNIVAWASHSDWNDSEDLIALMAIIGLPSE